MKAVQIQKDLNDYTSANTDLFVENDSNPQKAGPVITWTIQKDNVFSPPSPERATEREPSIQKHPFFTDKAYDDMTAGKIPNLEALYHMLSDIKEVSGHQLSAINFLPALSTFHLSDQEEIERFVQNPETNHVVAQNAQIKIVLIRWEPGTECRIHGHAIGGCIFKVLQGQVAEKRFSAYDQQLLLSENTYFPGSIAYIDDLIGHHSVGNEGDVPAITLHLYTPGNYKAKK